MKNILSYFLIIFLFVVCVVLAWRGLGKVSDYDNSSQALVGKQVVLGADTLTIVNYNWSGDLTLSNGVNIAQEYAEKHIINSTGKK